MAVDYQNIITREAPEIEALKIALMNAGIDLTKTGMTLPQQQVAGLTGLQQQAADYAGQGVGSYMPFLQGAGDMYGAAGDLYKQSTAEFDPTSYNKFMDPYLEQVVGQQYKDINRLGTQQQQDLSSQALQAGAFGGGRQAIGSAEIGRNVLDQQARTGGQLRSEGFRGAMGSAMSDFQNRMGRLSSAAGGYGSTAGGLATLGASLPGLKQQELGFMYDMGSKMQGQQQAGLDALYNNQLRQMMEPYQRLGFLSDIFQGAPSTQMQMTSSTSPTVSPFQQYLGYGIGGLSAAGGAKDLGLFG